MWSYSFRGFTQLSIDYWMISPLSAGEALIIVGKDNPGFTTELYSFVLAQWPEGGYMLKILRALVFLNHVEH